MTRDATQEERWDRERDYRKHDGPRPHDPPLPDRMNKPLTTAMDIVLCVRGMKNPKDAEFLIDQYAKTFAAGIPLDRRFALARLVGYCEGIVKSGILGEEELRLRSIIAEVLAAFNMPSKAERSDA